MEEGNMNDLPPRRINATLGFLFESAHENNDLAALTLAINTAEGISMLPFTDYEKAEFYYNQANAWGYSQNLSEDEANPLFDNPLIDKQIFLQRQALTHIRKTNDVHKHCQILTNLCITFNHIGRCSDALFYINEALQLNKDFGMAKGHKGMALFYYARFIWEPGQQFLFFQHAWKHLKAAELSREVYEGAQTEFARLADKIEQVHSPVLLGELPKHKNWFAWLWPREKRYRKWCLKNRLFLNPLNDLLHDSVAGHDYFSLPTMVRPVSYKPIFHNLFNQLKEEYTSARFLFFEGRENAQRSYADKGVTIVETGEYAEYSIALEKIKIAFRMSYSLFDKIGYFLYRYFELGDTTVPVYFKNVWYNKGIKEKGLRDRFQNSKNWPLRGLYWMSKDLADKDQDSPVEPDARHIANLRNYMEHKAFKIVSEGLPDGINEEDEYEISRYLLEDRTLRILQLARSAIQYLSFVVYFEESYAKKET